MVVAGGLTADGAASARVDLYDPKRERWLRLPDLPEAVHHAVAATRRDRLYVAGGYRRASTSDEISRRAWVLYDRRWHALPSLPEGRAAGGAAIVRNRLYVIGGVGPSGLARSSLYLDLRTLRWSAFRGLPVPREHLGVTALRGRIYAVGGRTSGLDTNTNHADVYDTVARHWSRLPNAPTRRGGNARHDGRRQGRDDGRRGARGHDPRGGRLRPRVGTLAQPAAQPEAPARGGRGGHRPDGLPGARRPEARAHREQVAPRPARPVLS